jgi:hypothetical protein
VQLINHQDTQILGTDNSEWKHICDIYPTDDNNLQVRSVCSFNFLVILFTDL